MSVCSEECNAESAFESAAYSAKETNKKVRTTAMEGALTWLGVQARVQHQDCAGRVHFH